MSSAKCALVTGGASGMGLSVVEDLVKQGWNVEIVDLDVKMGREAEARLGDQVHFTRANVIDYEQQANAFAQAWAKWARLDLVFANAGILDRTDFTTPASEGANGAPPKPDVLTVDVCLYGAIWSSYLALHYFRKNKNPAGALVITSSQGGIYPTPLAPLYGAAKTGIVGFVRSLGVRMKSEGSPITVNCICPGLVATPLANDALLAVFRKDMQTPASTIIKAVNMFINDASLSGQVGECSGKDILLREGLPYGNEAAEYMGEGKMADKIDFNAAVADIKVKALQYDDKLNMKE